MTPTGNVAARHRTLAAPARAAAVAARSRAADPPHEHGPARSPRLLIDADKRPVTSSQATRITVVATR